MEGKERKIGAATAQLPAGQTICYHYYCECAWRHVSAPVAKHGTASTRPVGKRHHGDATAKLCGCLLLLLEDTATADRADGRVTAAPRGGVCPNQNQLTYGQVSARNQATAASRKPLVCGCLWPPFVFHLNTTTCI